jgi:hypothetical protein
MCVLAARAMICTQEKTWQLLWLHRIPLNIGDGNPSHPNPRQIKERRVIRRIYKESCGCDKVH